MVLHPNFTVIRPSHGPKIWPWWKPLTISVCRCTHDPFWYFWITPISFNIWFYTRRGAWCWNWRWRKGVYDRSTM